MTPTVHVHEQSRAYIDAYIHVQVADPEQQEYLTTTMVHVYLY